MTITIEQALAEVKLWATVAGNRPDDLDPIQVKAVILHAVASGELAPVSDAPVLWAAADPGALVEVQELLEKLDSRVRDKITTLQEEKETLQGENIFLGEDLDEALDEVARLRELVRKAYHATKPDRPTGAISKRTFERNHRLFEAEVAAHFPGEVAALAAKGGE